MADSNLYHSLPSQRLEVSSPLDASGREAFVEYATRYFSGSVRRLQGGFPRDKLRFTQQMPYLHGIDISVSTDLVLVSGGSPSRLVGLIQESGPSMFSKQQAAVREQIQKVVREFSSTL